MIAPPEPNVFDLSAASLQPYSFLIGAGSREARLVLMNDDRIPVMLALVAGGRLRVGTVILRRGTFQRANEQRGTNRARPPRLP